MAEDTSNGGTSFLHRTTLGNGIRVVSEAIPSVRSVSVGIWVFTGSRDEQPVESGMSHFIEHMVFKGTSRRRMHHIAQRMESVGGYLNAFTTKEYTCYYARGLDEHLARAIDTVTDLVLEPSFPEKELDKEKEVVLEEMKMYEDTPEDYIFDLFEGGVYTGHALGRPVIGVPETVHAFSQQQLFDFIHTHYTPERIVMAVAGNVDHKRVVRFAEKAFTDTRRPCAERARVPVNGYTPQAIVETRPIQQAHLVLGTRAYDAYHPRRVPLMVLNTILGGGMSSLLNQNIREKYGFCYNIYSFANMHSDTGDVGVYMGTDASKVDRATKLIFRELDKLVQKRVSDRALSQAKSQVKGGIMLGLESMSNRMMRLGRQELYYHAHHSLDHVIGQVESVTVEQLREVAEALFDPQQFTRVVLLPSA